MGLKLKRGKNRRGSTLVLAFIAGALLTTALFYGWSRGSLDDYLAGLTTSAHIDNPYFSPLPPCNTDTSTNGISGAPVTITSPLDMSCIQSNSTVTIEATVPDSSVVEKVKFNVYTNYLPQGKGVTYNFNCEDTTSPYTCDWQVPRGKVLGWTYYIAPSVEFNSGYTSYGKVVRVYTANPKNQ